MTEHKPDTDFSSKLDELFCKDRNEGALIECGASNGIHNSVGLYFEQRGWKAVNIEPNPGTYKGLIVNRPDSLWNLNLALSDTVGEATFKWKTGNLCDGTLEDKSLGIKETSALVSTTTYKKMVENLALKRVDLFILDVEGHEASVIRGMEGTSVWPDYFVIETNKHNPPEVVAASLAPHGYSVVGSGPHRNRRTGEPMPNTYFSRLDSAKLLARNEKLPVL